MKSLDIRVAFSAIDRLTRPVNAARQSAGGLSESLKRTQAAIKDLDNQSRTFNRLRDSVQKTSRKIDEASRSLDGLKKAQQNNTVLTDKQREHMAALAAKLERLNVTRDQEMVKLRAVSQAYVVTVCRLSAVTPLSRAPSGAPNNITRHWSESGGNWPRLRRHAPVMNACNRRQANCAAAA
ncbi:hypothetical protein OS11_40780 [Dickeya oryzae]